MIIINFIKYVILLLYTLRFDNVLALNDEHVFQVSDVVIMVLFVLIIIIMGIRYYKNKIKKM